MSNLIFNFRISKFHFQIMKDKSVTLKKNKRITITRNDFHPWFGWPFIQLHELGKYSFSTRNYKIRAKPFFAWYDFYIGFYFSTRLDILYFVLLMFGIKFYLEEVFYCNWCDMDKKQIELINHAHHTGDGWILGTECPKCGDTEDSDHWPFGDNLLDADDLKAAGYIIV